jgi:hypothetical protein
MLLLSGYYPVLEKYCALLQLYVLHSIALAEAMYSNKTYVQLF